jgi:hypothetical protein
MSSNHLEIKIRHRGTLHEPNKSIFIQFRSVLQEFIGASVVFFGVKFCLDF